MITLSLSCSVPLFRSCLFCSVPVKFSSCPALSMSCSVPVLSQRSPSVEISTSPQPLLQQPPIRGAAPTYSHHHLSRAICSSNHSRRLCSIAAVPCHYVSSCSTPTPFGLSLLRFVCASPIEPVENFWTVTCSQVPRLHYLGPVLCSHHLVFCVSVFLAQ